jgi:hypothetical protein
MNLDHLMPEVFARLEQLANSGGPMSRTRKERIHSTLLGNDDGVVRCPRVVRMGINCPHADPVEVLADLLAEEGFGSPEDLRDALDIPQRRLLARPFPGYGGLVHTSYDARRDVLWNALVLGLCTAQVDATPGLSSIHPDSSANR